MNKKVTQFFDIILLTFLLPLKTQRGQEAGRNLHFELFSFRYYL